MATTPKPAPKTEAAPRMTEAQRSYEAKRAAKNGMSLEKWLALKEKERVEERRAATADAGRRAAEVAPPKKPNLFRRLLDRAQQPIKPGR